jgi:cold shock CspA family protein
MLRTTFTFSAARATGFFSFTQLLGATGTVRTWAPGRKFGFVVEDESQKSYFAHADDCVWASPKCNKNIAEGERVEFQLQPDRRRNDGSRRCANVTLVGGQPLPSGPHAFTPRDTSVPGEDPNADKGELIGKKDVKGTIHGIARTFGFIVFKDDDMRKFGTLFFHASSVMPGVTLRVGDDVVFDIIEDNRAPKPGQVEDNSGKKKVRAINVTKLL